MRVSGSRHLYNFVSSESGNTLLLLIEKVVLTTLGLLKRNLFKVCYSKSERNKFMKLVGYFLFRFDILKQMKFYTTNITLILDERHCSVNWV